MSQQVRSQLLTVDFAAGTGTQTKTIVLPYNVRVLSAVVKTSAAVATGALNVDVTVAGTSIYAVANDKPRVAIAATQSTDGTTNTNYKAVATATSTANGATVAYQAENPTADLTGKWTSSTPSTTASVAGDSVAVILSGSYASVAAIVTLEIEKA